MHPFTCEILVAPCEYEPRVQWTVAHELGEQHTPNRLEPEWHEAYCDRIAAAILMPSDAFVASARRCDLRLPPLCVWWPHASREAILTRIADLFPRTTASSWRGSDAKFRRAHAGYRPPRSVLDLEAFCAAEAAWFRQPSEVREGSLVARAWPAGDDRALSLCVAA